jgi:peptidoglycan-N-acetylglucosamine deacetylase
MLFICLIFSIGVNWEDSLPKVARQASKDVQIALENKSKVLLVENHTTLEEIVSVEPRAFNSSFEELSKLKERPEAIPSNMKNTSVDEDEFAVKAEIAYTFGRGEGKKYAFLTFDDGPSKNITPKILDTLKKYNVKATFFLLGIVAKYNSNIVKRQVSEGHAIANHTYSHKYKVIYPNRKVNTKVFSKELLDTQRIVNNIFGEEIFMRVVRFPGGSFEKWKNPMKEELKNRGMYYIDWNIENGDGLKHNISPKEQMNKIKRQISWAESANKNLVILMHDAPSKKTTLEALPSIIEYIKSKGYEFRILK